MINIQFIGGTLDKQYRWVDYPPPLELLFQPSPPPIPAIPFVPDNNYINATITVPAQEIYQLQRYEKRNELGVLQYGRYIYVIKGFK